MLKSVLLAAAMPAALPIFGQTCATVEVWDKDMVLALAEIDRWSDPEGNSKKLVEPDNGGPGGPGGGGIGGPSSPPPPRGFRMVQDWIPTQDHRILAGGSWDNYSFVDPLPGCGIGLSNTFQSSWEGSLSAAEFGIKVGYQESVTLTWTTGVNVSPRRHGELLLYGVMWKCTFEDVRLLGTLRGSATQAKSIHSVYADRPVSPN